jgi:hypothetical protein
MDHTLINKGPSGGVEYNLPRPDAGLSPPAHLVGGKLVILAGRIARPRGRLDVVIDYIAHMVPDIIPSPVADDR